MCYDNANGVLLVKNFYDQNCNESNNGEFSDDGMDDNENDDDLMMMIAVNKKCYA